MEPLLPSKHTCDTATPKCLRSGDPYFFGLNAWHNITTYCERVILQSLFRIGICNFPCELITHLDIFPIENTCKYLGIELNGAMDRLRK